MNKSLALLLSTLKMALATFLSRILGLVREQVMAATFGASGLTDAFLVAFRIPNLLRDLFAEGAFSSAFVPTFVDARKDGEEHAQRLLWRLVILLLLITGTIATLMIVFAPELIQIFAPSFNKDAQKFELTIMLTRLMAPFLCFVSMAALFMGALNSLKVFFIPALAPAAFNITMILTMLLVPPYLIDKGIHPIMSLGMGVFLGGLIQALLQVPLLFKYQFFPRLGGTLLGKREKKVFMLLGPGLVGFAATQINLLINTILASSAAIGAVSWLSYSFRLFQLPIGILGVSIGNSNLVHFSQAWKSGEREEAKKLLLSSFFISLMFILPTLALLAVFSEEVVNLIFERGKFTRESTLMTAKALRWYALGLPFYGLVKLFTPTFYSLDQQRLPVICSIFSIVFNIIFCVSLTPLYGFQILAMGTSFSVLLNACLQLFFLKRHLLLKYRDFFNWRLFKILFTTLSAVGLAIMLKDQINFLASDFFQRTWQLLWKFVVVGSCYIIMILAMGEKEALRKIRRS